MQWRRQILRFASSSSRLEKLQKQVVNGPGLNDFVHKPMVYEDIVLPSAETKGLVDSFGRQHTYLRISLTERCNLRCTYCMPEEGVQLQPTNQLLSTEEIVSLAKVFAQAGVNKIRLTGGEPLVRKDIVSLCEQLRQIDGIEQLGITTNGLVLKKKLPLLKQAGVTHLNISLDTLNERKFQEITRRRGFEKVMLSIHEAIAIGFSKLKLNCVVMKGFNDNELVDFVKLTQQLPIDIRFIEWMPFDSNRWNDSKFMSYRDMLSILSLEFPTIERLADQPHDTSKAYRLDDSSIGQFGFITSMSEHFCGSCNRLRLTADGNLKVCLFGSAEVSLRDAFRRNDPSLTRVIQAAVLKKPFALGGHGDMHGIAKSKNRPMILIGG